MPKPRTRVGAILERLGWWLLYRATPLASTGYHQQDPTTYVWLSTSPGPNPDMPPLMVLQIRDHRTVQHHRLSPYQAALLCGYGTQLIQAQLREYGDLFPIDWDTRNLGPLAPAPAPEATS